MGILDKVKGENWGYIMAIGSYFSKDEFIQRFAEDLDEFVSNN